MMRMALGLGLCLLMVFTTGAARADVFVVAPPVYAGTDGREVSTRIVQAIKGALSTAGKVIMPEEAVNNLPPEQRKWCGTSECLERHRVAADATAAVVVRVHRLSRGLGPATSFDIGLQPKPGLEYNEGVVLDSKKTLEEQAQDAVGKVLSKYRLGPGPHLTITGAPRDAVVFVDNEIKARKLPAFVTVPSGDHHVRVEATGFTPQIFFVPLSSPTSLEELTVRLEPATHATPAPGASLTIGRDAATPPMTKKQRVGVGLMVAGSSLFATGAAFTIVSALAGDGGECLKSDANFCLRRETDSDKGKRVGLGAAAAALGAATVLGGAILFKREKNRLRVTASASPFTASLGLRGDF